MHSGTSVHMRPHTPAFSRAPVPALRQNIRAFDRNNAGYCSTPILCTAPADRLPGKLRIIVVPVYQPTHPVGGIVVELQPAQNSRAISLPRAPDVRKMIHALFVRRPAGRLCNVMQQHRKPEHLIRRHRFRSPLAYALHTVAMMRIVLRRLHHHVKLRQKNSRKSHSICHFQALPDSAKSKSFTSST